MVPVPRVVGRDADADLAPVVQARADLAGEVLLEGQSAVVHRREVPFREDNSRTTFVGQQATQNHVARSVSLSNGASLSADEIPGSRRAAG
jgi:hypothetical protein